MSKRKPVLPNLSALIRGMEGDGANVDATDAELRAAEAIIRAARRVASANRGVAWQAHVVGVFDALDRALARLDRVTGRKP